MQLELPDALPKACMGMSNNLLAPALNLKLEPLFDFTAHMVQVHYLYQRLIQFSDTYNLIEINKLSVSEMLFCNIFF